MEPRAKTGNSPLEAKTGGSSSAPGARPSANANVAKRGSVDPPRILVVEDQEDVRRMVATALEIEGYRVDEASSAHDGLEKLRRHSYQLVLTDYAMPGGTGTWMLQEAARLDLMRGAVAVIITAHPDVRHLARVAVINKPVDLDAFLDQIRKIIESVSTS
jgi:DNA-binding NtrC family response regulator